MKMVIVTASSSLLRAKKCLQSWRETAPDAPIFVVRNGGNAAEVVTIRDMSCVSSREYLGSVPAFALGVQKAMQLHPDADVIACLHDDLEILEQGWDQKVLEHFATHPHTGLAGFFGASGIGDADIYRTPYSPWQLARNGCRSNIEGAEAHGVRSGEPSRVAVLDGFSLIGRASFFNGLRFGSSEATIPIWQQLVNLGLVHHIYDGALGMLAARLGWETWFLPIRCMHYGGRTAVADAGYNEWAQKKVEGGDQGFWNAGHKIVYEAFRDVLPLRVS
jgi:hypothetical protein